MKTYRAIVHITYYQTITLAAASAEEAKASMVDGFVVEIAEPGHVEISDFEEVEDEHG